MSGVYDGAVTPSVLSGALGVVGTVAVAWITGRFRRVEARDEAETGAYSRAVEIDRGVNERLIAENARLIAQHEADRLAWEDERAQLRAELAELEARCRALLTDFMELRARHGLPPTEA